MLKRPLALVTGASSGIGRAIALELAARDYDLVLIGRDAAALESAAGACEAARAGVRAFVEAVDLSKADETRALVERLRAQGSLPDALVNNAGFSVHGAFAETDLEQELALVQTQLSAMMILTKAFLPGMLARGSGRILNVASVYSYSPVPFQSIYGACKAFMLSFADAISNEIGKGGVTITTLCPGVTRTEFRRRAGMRDKGSRAGHSAEVVARAGVEAMLAGRAVSVPGLVNKFFVTMARLIPRPWVSPAMRKINQIRGVAPK